MLLDPFMNKCIFPAVSIPIFLVLFLNSVSLTAQDDTYQRTFDKADKNDDGKLTRDEVKNLPLFKQMDSDSDGVVTAGEVLARRRKSRTGKTAVATVEASNVPVFPMKPEGEIAKRTVAKLKSMA